MKLEKVLKAYVLQKAIKEATKASRTMKKRFNDIDWDADTWLHRVGLTTYKPGKSATGAISLLVAGAVVGGAVALMLAPKKGAELRTDLMNRFREAEPDAFTSQPSPTATRIDPSPNNMPM